ncbi:hypothetical protein D3C71_2060610 [compost metagenome]
MVKRAFNGVFNPLGVKTTAGVGRIPRRAKTALRKSLRGHLTQRGDVLFGRHFCDSQAVLRDGKTQIDFAFH